MLTIQFCTDQWSWLIDPLRWLFGVHDQSINIRQQTMFFSFYLLMQNFMKNTKKWCFSEVKETQDRKSNLSEWASIWEFGFTLFLNLKQHVFRVSQTILHEKMTRKYEKTQYFVRCRLTDWPCIPCTPPANFSFWMNSEILRSLDFIMISQSTIALMMYRGPKRNGLHKPRNW